MSQGSLFLASEYLADAYDKLVLAYNQMNREEIAVLKNAVMRAYGGLRQEWEQTKLPLEDVVGVDDVEVPF